MNEESIRDVLDFMKKKAGNLEVDTFTGRVDFCQFP